MIRLEFRLDPDGTATTAVESEDWHPTAEVEPWLAAWRDSLARVITEPAAQEAAS